MIYPHQLLLICTAIAIGFTGLGYSLQPDTHVVERVRIAYSPQPSCDQTWAGYIPASALRPMGKK